MVRARRDGFCFSQHSRSQDIDVRGVSRLYNLHHLTARSEGMTDALQRPVLIPGPTHYQMPLKRRVGRPAAWDIRPA